MILSCSYVPAKQQKDDINAIINNNNKNNNNKNNINNNSKNQLSVT